MIAEIDAYLTHARASKVPLSFILASLRLGLPINAACFMVNPGLLGKLRMLAERCSSLAERISLTSEPWMTDALQEAFCNSASRTAFAATSYCLPSAAAGELNSDSFKPYRKARCWTRQKEYYANAGIGAWCAAKAPVPSQVSSNLFVAEQYLALVVAQVARMSSCSSISGTATRPEREGPGFRVNIVEAASGHGALSILLARLLQTKSLQCRVEAYHASTNTSKPISPTTPKPKQAATAAADMKASVICTDFHDSVFRSLDRLSLPWLDDLCCGSERLLDFAVIDADNELPCMPLPLLSGRRSDQLPCDLLVIIAQYAFDSFASDIYATVAADPDPAVADTKEGSFGILEKSDSVWEIGIQCTERADTNTNAREELDNSKDNPVKRARTARRRRRVQLEQMVARPLEAIRDPHSATALEFLCSKVPPPAAGNAHITSVPTAGKALLQHIKNAFPVNANNISNQNHAISGSVMMITGDFVIEPDDARWGGEQVGAAIAIRKASKEVRTGVSVSVTLDPPEISPRPEITAFPVCLSGLDLIFSHAFPSPQRSLSVRAMGSLGGSCFTVVVQVNGPVDADASMLRFGPAEYQTMRDFIRAAECNGFSSCISIKFLRSFILLGGSNWRQNAEAGLMHENANEGGELQVILDIRWLIFRLCKQEMSAGGAGGDELLSFVRLALDAVFHRKHSWLSYEEASHAKCQLAQWMLAISAALRVHSHPKWQFPLINVFRLFRYDRPKAGVFPENPCIECFCSRDEAVLTAMALSRIQSVGEAAEPHEVPQHWAFHSTQPNQKERKYIYAGSRRHKQFAKIMPNLSDVSTS